MRLLLVILIGLSAEAWEIATDFPGASAELVKADAAAGFLHIRPQARKDRGWPCWWYCRVDGIPANTEFTLRVSGQRQPFRGGSRLGASWALPDQAAISADNANWTHTAKFRRVSGANDYRITAPASPFWVAWGPPFLPNHAEELLAEFADSGKRFTLATSREGRLVNGISVGNGQKAVWVQARQHAWESGSSWVARGFLEWTCSEDAAELREQATIYVTPIMDIDNVAIGAGGKDAVPRDHNRDWAAEPVYPEVAAAQARILDLEKAERLVLYLDLHNPAPSNRQPYFYGPAPFTVMSKPLRDNHQRWIKIVAAKIANLKSDYVYASYIKTDEERGRVSSNWVRRRTKRAVACTLETPWNSPASTTDGYRKVGAQLGQAVAEFVK